MTLFMLVIWANTVIDDCTLPFNSVASAVQN
ncbi:Uncharacterised protein [Vibrio cholerae]|uniref:Uncharacterized protein n=1 Tax=Vibrio cholerae TaxID=666 RepID=A0A656AIY0_VIBCL|nr:Uncharacterised protein [Vibrio cholerae]CSI48215.1 Uncharacterised protein [Vibrio cholerae]CSI48824.1 Uncharacterised protein [Vibrio cholerae]